MTSTRRTALIAASIVAAVLASVGAVFWVLSGADDVEEVVETTAAPTTESTTTTTEPPSGPIAPLTGERVPEADASLLDRPALAAKIDNAPAAMPHWGLGAADLVIELRVEGISRFAAVYHSRDVGDVGPIRSARTSDPDLLAMFGRPLSAWSGANVATAGVMRSTPWLQNVDIDRLGGLYRRSTERRAPHNLVLDARAAFGAAEESSEPPTPVFGYVEPEVEPRGRPVDGVRVAVGASRSTYAWDAERNGWARFVNGRPHTDVDGAPLIPRNLVVLATEYERSSADPRSPQARSTGGGRAWVFSAGHLIEGSWLRPERTDPWILLDGDGEPIDLRPGVTWVAMPDVSSDPGLISEAEAARLLAEG